MEYFEEEPDTLNVEIEEGDDIDDFGDEEEDEADE